MRNAVLASLLAGTLFVSPSAWAASACDVNLDGNVNVVDVQLVVGMAVGAAPCSVNILGPGVCTSDTVNRVMTAALGGSCTTSSSHTVTLRWNASTSPGVAGYNVYRSTTSGGSYNKINSSIVTGTTYTDSTVQSGKTYYYVTTAVNTGNVESGYSNQAAAAVPNP